MRPIRHILCAVDFSAEARHALDYAIVLAQWYDATLAGVFVYTPLFAPVPAVDGGSAAMLSGLDTSDRRAYEEQIDSFLSPAKTAGVRIAARLAIGRPSDGIIEAAKSAGTDLIVMGTHGATGYQHLVLGSVAEHVVRRATCPVMTVPARSQTTSRAPFARILCPVDFGEPSTAAAELAVSIATEGDAQLQFLHVMEPGADTEPRESRRFTVPEYHREREAQASRQLAALTAGDVAFRCRPSTRIAHGKPYREILAVAAETRADLIVMGVHGRNPIDVALFGSTTNQVVRRATCPVLTVRA